MRTVCNFFWGSHGCDRTRGDHVTHFCGLVNDPCCIFVEDGGEVTDQYGTFRTGSVRFCYQTADHPVPRPRSDQDWAEKPMPGWRGWYQR